MGKIKSEWVLLTVVKMGASFGMDGAEKFIWTTQTY
jgi:hypothetical protein